MPITHTNAKGQTFSLYQGTTKTGKPKYYFAMQSEGILAQALPAGYEIYENPNAQVFLRRIPPKIIMDEERQIVEDGMRRYATVKDYKIDVRGKALLIYTAIQEIDALADLYKAISQKEFPYSGCWYRIDQNVVLGQGRMSLPSCCNRLHRRLTECHAFWVDFVAELDDRMKPLPGHPLGPLQHRLCIDPLRPIPLQCQDTPAPLDGIIFAVVRRIIQELNRLVHGVGELHHAMQKLRTPATALRAIIHFDLQQTRSGLLVFVQGIPLGCECVHDEVTRFVGAAKGDRQLGALLIDDPTRDILLFAPHIMITGLVVAPGETAT